MYGARKRRRRAGRKTVLLLAAVTGVVVWTWPRSGDWARQVLTGQRAPQEESLALQPLNPSDGDATERLNVNRPQESPAPADPPRSPTVSPARTPETQPAHVSPPAAPAPPVASPPVAARSGAPIQPFVQLVSPAVRTTPPAQAAGSADRAGTEHLTSGLAFLEDDGPLQARNALNRALQAGLSGGQARQAKDRLQELADRLLFSKAVLADDPLVSRHIVVSGDTTGRIARRAKVSDYLLADINSLPNRNFIREGQTLKLLNGPFHATINKSTHEMHAYLQDTYVRTFRVALGEDGSTPTGLWRVINQLENPGWTDPRTGQHWHPDDPDNPIGDYWIGLQCVEGECMGMTGYGIHGTIEPETIGQDVSMGCVRLADDDIELVYKMLAVGESLVLIHD